MYKSISKPLVGGTSETLISKTIQNLVDNDLPEMKQQKEVLVLMTEFVFSQKKKAKFFGLRKSSQLNELKKVLQKKLPRNRREQINLILQNLKTLQLMTHQFQLNSPSKLDAFFDKKRSKILNAIRPQMGEASPV